jgi:predicted PurR-regulated permease PerM
MSEAAADEAAHEPIGSSPTHISSPQLRYEAKRAAVWVAIVGLALLIVYVSQSLLVIFGAMVFAAMLDGGARLVGRVLPIARSLRLLVVLLLVVAFFVWLSYFAGSQISEQAAQFPTLVSEQLARLFAWLESRGFAVSQSDVSSYASSLVSGVGTVTRAIGGIFGSLATVFLIVIIGIYVAFEPRLYERSVAWLLPSATRGDFYVTASRMGATMRRLMAGRLVGMFFEGVFTWIMLFAYGVPMAALLGILTGLLAFIPNLGALIAGILMVLVGFSGGTEMGLYTIFVYFLVQTFDGYVVIPLIAKKTVDLAPAMVLASQLIMGILFGVLGLFLADPLMAMIKVWLERRAEMNDRENPQPAAAHGA